MNRICVFCGSSSGADRAFVKAARSLGSALALREVELVYGGAKVGIMRELADATLSTGGTVIGVMPRAMAEKAHPGLSKLHLVDSMHQRKRLMHDLSDGFIALPGGLGTLDEFFEAVTWAQLGLHHKPCGLLNISNYYDNLLEFLDHAVTQQFMRPTHRDLFLVEKDPQRLLQRFVGVELGQE